MTDNWRRRRTENSSQEVARARKPPLGNWQATVPSWEKEFCTVVGSLPWRKFLDAKKFIHLYDNVLKWNDSAGEEAFINAKNRFWAHINGLPCQIPSPDPDIYNDKIDWNSDVDPQLMMDLESESIAPENQGKGEQVVILGELFSNNLYSPSGWGDAEDDMKKTGLPSENKENPWEYDCTQANITVGQNGWGDVCNDSRCENQGTRVDMKKTGLPSENKENPWEYDCTQANVIVGQNGWGDVCNDSWRENQGTGVVENSGWEDGWNQWENKDESNTNLQYGRNSGVWEPLDANQENTGGYTSRYKTSRFQGNDNPTNRKEWRNGKPRKRVNFVCELPYMENSQRNLMNSCAPVRHHGSAKRGNQWRWEKPVS